MRTCAHTHAAHTTRASVHTHGAVSRWTDFVAAGKGSGARPRMIMPLIVEPKPGRPDKFRLIHDCRVLNELLEKLPFKMERFVQSVAISSVGVLIIGRIGICQVSDPTTKIWEMLLARKIKLLKC